MADEALIQIEDLWKVYRAGDLELTALREVTLSIQPGEFVALMGPSGSGKSTLMNLLGCLDRPTRGRYRLDGTDVAELGSDARAALRNRKIGFVFQGFNLLARSTALENVELPLLYGGLPAAERRSRAAAALTRVGLGDRLQSRPVQLSGGQQQRVAIARALVMRPPLILADEPTGNLDSRTSYEIMALLQELNAGGLTVVLVTHEADVAHCARRLLLFRDGRLRSDAAVATPVRAAEWLARPEPAGAGAGSA